MSPTGCNAHSAVPSYIEDGISTVLSAADSVATLTREQAHFDNVADTTEIAFSQRDNLSRVDASSALQERNKVVSNSDKALSDADLSARQQIPPAALSFHGITTIDSSFDSVITDFLSNPKFSSSDDDTMTTVQKNLIILFQAFALFEDCHDVGTKKSRKSSRRKLLRAILRTMGTCPASFKGVTAIDRLLATYGGVRHAELLRLQTLGQSPTPPTNPRTALLIRLIDRYLVFKDTWTPIPQPSNTEDLKDRESKRVQTLQSSLEAILSSADTQHDNQDEQSCTPNAPQSMFTTFAAMIPCAQVELKWFQPSARKQDAQKQRAQKHFAEVPPTWAVPNVDYSTEFRRIFCAAENLYTLDLVLHLFQFTSKAFQTALYNSLRVKMFTGADHRSISIIEQQYVVQHCEPRLSRVLKESACDVQTYFFPCLALANSANSTAGHAAKQEVDQAQSRPHASQLSGSNKAGKQIRNQQDDNGDEKLDDTTDTSTLKGLVLTREARRSEGDHTRMHADTESVERARDILKVKNEEWQQEKIQKMEDTIQTSMNTGHLEPIKRKRDILEEDEEDDNDEDRHPKLQESENQKTNQTRAWTNEVKVLQQEKSEEAKKQANKEARKEARKRAKRAKVAREEKARRDEARKDWLQALKQAQEKSGPLTSRFSWSSERAWVSAQSKWEQMDKEDQIEWFEAKTESLPEAYYQADLDAAQTRLSEAQTKQAQMFHYQLEVDEAQRRLKETQSQRIRYQSEVDEAQRLLDEATALRFPYQSQLDKAQRCLDEIKNAKAQWIRQRFYWERRLEVEKYKEEWWSFRKDYEKLGNQEKMDWDQGFIRKCQKPWKDAQDKEIQQEWQSAFEEHARAEAVRAEMEQAQGPGKLGGKLMLRSSAQTYYDTRDYSSFWALYLA